MAQNAGLEIGTKKLTTLDPISEPFLEVHLGALSSKIRRRCSLGHPKPKGHCGVPKSSIWDLFEVDLEPFGDNPRVPFLVLFL